VESSKTALYVETFAWNIVAPDFQFAPIDGSPA